LATTAPVLLPGRIDRLHHRQERASERFGIELIGTGRSNQLAKLASLSLFQTCGLLFERL
jgi:hypothetical protein